LISGTNGPRNAGRNAAAPDFETSFGEKLAHAVAGEKTHMGAIERSGILILKSAEQGL
jgi:hypothetical protein